MTDLDQLLQPREFRGKECHTKQLLDRLDETTRQKLQAALDDHRVATTAISEWLAGNDLGNIAPTNLRRHRNRGTNLANRCACQ